MQTSVGALLLVASLGAPGAAAAQGLDIEAWLARPGVKLVAVELYATWCKPCMDAVPRWKALHDKYKKDGLRLIVVATRDPEAGCVNPGWTPDDTICDDDGSIAEALGSGDTLPAAYLWSWQGDLLVRNGHVAEVEAAVEKWIQKAPRVAVQVGGGQSRLQDLLEAEIARGRKLDVVRDGKARNDLRREYARSLAARPSKGDDARCDSDLDLTPRSVLSARVTGASGAERLQLGLLSVERGCMVAHAVAPWSDARPAVSVAEAYSSLLRALGRKPKMPRSIAPRGDVAVTTFEGDDGRGIVNPAVDDKGFVFVTSEPPHAEVTLNGKVVGVTPFQTELMAGEYVVVVNKSALYAPARQRIELTRRGAKLNVKLAPNYGVLEVHSDPTGAAISIDNEPTGQSAPHTFPPKRAGTYVVTGSLPLYAPGRAEVTLADGKPARVVLRLAPNWGVLSIRSEPAGLPVMIDGKAVEGRTPLKLDRLPAGLHRVEVSSPTLEPQTQRVTVVPGELSELAFEMKPRTGEVKLTATIQRDGRTEPVRAEIWIDGERHADKTPLRASLPIGEHRVQLRVDGAAPYEETIAVAEGRVAEVKARLVIASKPADVPASVTPPAPPADVASVVAQPGSPADGSSAGAWVTGFGGALAAAGFVATIVGKTALTSAVDDAKTPDALVSAIDTMEATTTAGIITAGVGGAVLLTGLGMLIWGGDDEAMQAGLQIEPDGVRVDLGGRF